jgi:hypothetical protein
MTWDPHRSPVDPDHPAEEDFLRFVTGSLAPSEVRRIVRHLLRDCPTCRTVTRRLWALGGQGPHPVPPEVATTRRGDAFHGRP